MKKKKRLLSVCVCVCAHWYLWRSPKAFDSVPPSSYYRPHDALEMNTGGELRKPPTNSIFDNPVCMLDFDFLLRAPMALLANNLKTLISQRTQNRKEKPNVRETCALRMNPTREAEYQDREFNFSGNGVFLLSSESFYILLYFALIISEVQFLIYNSLTT